MTSQTSKQIIIIHILSHILRSKGNRAIKSRQLIEYKVRNLFLKKSYRKGDWETSFRLLLAI